MPSLGENYLVDLSKCLGQGYFGKLFMGIDRRNGERVAVKVGSRKNISHEFDMCRALMRSRKDKKFRDQPRRFVRMLFFNPNFHWNNAKDSSALAMELLGKDLGKLFAEAGREFSTKTTLMIAIQLLQCLEQLHSADILHCDLKPENFLVGKRNSGQESRIYAVDFGMAKEYRIRSRGDDDEIAKNQSSTSGDHSTNHVESDDKRHAIRGTLRYISIESHKGKVRSRRDEIESLSYVLIYFLRGGWLPWRGLTKANKGNTTDRRAHNDLVREVKENTKTRTLCQGVPKCYRHMLEKSRRMEFKERPDYKALRHSFEEEMRGRGMTLDFVFDWMHGHGHGHGRNVSRDVAIESKSDYTPASRSNDA